MKPLRTLACPSCGYPLRPASLEGVPVLRCANCGLTSPDAVTREVSGYADQQVQRRLQIFGKAKADRESEEAP